MTPTEFAELLARAREGNQAAQTTLLTALQEKLRAAAQRRLGTLQGAVESMDVVQSAQKSLLICLRKGRYDLPDEEKLTALAMRILQRKVFQRHRTAKKDREVRDAIARHSGGRAESSGRAEQAVEDKERVKIILGRMSKTQRELAERIMAGESIASAARNLGITPNYARVILNRMKKEFKDLFPDSRPRS